MKIRANIQISAKPTLPTNFEENTWATLKSAIGAIFLKQPNPCDLEKLYQAVNDLYVDDPWYSFVPRSHIREANTKRALVVGHGLAAFPQTYFFSFGGGAQNRVWSSENDREGEVVNRTLLNHLLKMFTALGIYPESFEKPFLEGSFMQLKV
ncbi:hypothetical protein CASFOL_031454 [Castilleja foliolosa]|uniref:Uncharacterized protein n=1 Tax=Castilleja foliolosa TaxID=1961234 RepID=A0ABD3C4R1_9LAMI